MIDYLPEREAAEKESGAESAVRSDLEIGLSLPPPALIFLSNLNDEGFLFSSFERSFEPRQILPLFLFRNK